MAINAADKYSLDMSGQTDNSTKLAQLASDIAALYAAKKPLPRVVFPEGIVAFDQWPNLAYQNIQIVAEGECHLRHTGSGDAVTFDGAATYPAPQQPGPDNVIFEGFIVEPGDNSANGVVINCCHRSYFDVIVHPTVMKPNYAGIAAIFCVLTEIRPMVRGAGIGLVMDALQTNTVLCSTACRIVRPILESCQWGAYIKNAAYTNFYDGSIESCNVGIQVDIGGNNHFILVEMEGNTTYDALTSTQAHDNLFWECGNGHPPSFKANLQGWNNRLVHGALEGLFGL